MYVDFPRVVRGTSGDLKHKRYVRSNSCLLFQISGKKRGISSIRRRANAKQENQGISESLSHR